MNSRNSFVAIGYRTEEDRGGLKFARNASQVNNKAVLAAFEMGKPVQEQRFPDGE